MFGQDLRIKFPFLLGLIRDDFIRFDDGVCFRFCLHGFWCFVVFGFTLDGQIVFFGLDISVIRGLDISAAARDAKRSSELQF